MYAKNGIMDKDLVQDYLQRSGMNDAQAEALSRILDQMATKEHLEMKLESLKADLTWRMIAMTVFLATIITMLNVFVE